MYNDEPAGTVDYDEMTSGGAYLEFERAAGFYKDPQFEDLHNCQHHAGVRKMPDGALKYWVHWGQMTQNDFRLDNPNVMWFDDAKDAFTWLVACWRMR